MSWERYLDEAIGTSQKKVVENQEEDWERYLDLPLPVKKEEAKPVVERPTPFVPPASTLTRMFPRQPGGDEWAGLKLPPTPKRTEAKMSALPAGTVPGRLGMPKYTGSKGEELLSNFMSRVANGIVQGAGMLVGVQFPSVATPQQGIPGETPTAIAGEIAGAVPSIGLAARGIHFVLQKAVTGLPANMRLFVESAVKAGFTYDMMSKALSGATEFVDAVKSGDYERTVSSAAGTLMDSLFAFFIAKGLPKDAAAIADYRRTGMAPEYPSATPKSPERQAAARTPSPELEVKAEKAEAEPAIKSEIQATNKKVKEFKRRQSGMPQAKAEDQLKINRTQTSEFEMLPGDVEKLENHFGDNWDELPNNMLEEYLTRVRGGEKVEPSVKAKEVLPEEDFTPEELAELEVPDKFERKPGQKPSVVVDLVAKALKELEEDDLREVKDIDLMTGTETPSELRGEASPFRSEPDVTKAQKLNYEKSRMVASSFDDLVNPTEAPKSPLVTTHKLLNDFNRWLDGEEVSSERTREFLSDLATRTDELKWQFVDEEGNLDTLAFDEFRLFASDAAEWARKTERGSKGLGTSLYFGLPIDQAGKMMKTWYSALKRYAEEKLPNRASGAQIIATLRKGSTQDEWKQVQLESLLEGGKSYTKEEVIKAIDGNLVEFKDVMLISDDKKIKVRQNRIDEINNILSNHTRVVELDHDTYHSLRQERGRLEVERYQDEGMAPKFSSYQEPGGSNYRELFVTSSRQLSDKIVPAEVIQSNYSGEYYISSGGMWKEGPFKTKAEADKALASKIPDRFPYEWKDGHSDYSDIENPIVRLRMNDRTDSQGNKVLFLEELQPPAPNEQAKMPPEFQKRWREIGMKRAIKYAIDNGYDRVAWTTGEMQANRYSLDTQINSIDYWKNLDGTYSLWPNGVQNDNFSEIPGNRLHEYVGPEVAKRILNNEGEYARGDVDRAAIAYYGRTELDHLLTEEPIPGGGYLARYSDDFKNSPEWKAYVDGRTLSGLNLKNENKGLRQLYDRDIPNVVRKLGGKVEEARIITRPADSISGYSPEQLEIMKRNRDIITEPTTVSVLSTPVSSFLPRAQGGFAMYAIFPFDKLSDVAKGIINYEKAAEKLKHLSPKEVYRIVRDISTNKWISQSGNIRREMEKYGDRVQAVIQAQATAKSGHPRAVNTYRQAVKEYRKGMSAEDKKITDRLIMARRVDAIAKTESGKKVKYPEAYSLDKSKQLIDGIAKGEINGSRDLSPEKAADISRSADTYFEWERKAVRDAYEEGLIGAKEKDWLLANDYFRFSHVEQPTIAGIFDKRREVRRPGKAPINVYDSGIESMARGKTTNIFETNSELVMLETFHRLYNRIMANRANRELQKLAREDKNNPFVKVREPKTVDMSEQPKSRKGLIQSIHIKKDELGMSDFEYKTKLREMFKKSSSKYLTNEQLAKLDTELGGPSKEYMKQAPSEKVPKGWKRHFVYENGARKTIWLEPKFSEEWLTSSSEVTSGFAKFLRIFLGTQVVKTFATGVNPVFAIANLPRDVMHAWMASRVFENGQWKSLYSSLGPKAALQLGRDLKQVTYDAFYRTGRYNDYIDDGGGTDMLVVQGNPLRKKGFRAETGVDKMWDFFSYLNETSELMTRLAIRERVIKLRAKERGIPIEEARKDKGIRREATFAAMDQMPFHEGGGFSKAIDNGIPYFNARIQATRSLWRMFKPGRGTATDSVVKLAQFAGLVTALYVGFNKMYPEAMKDLKNDPRSIGNIVFPLSNIGYKDNKGQTRYPFVKIPIDQSQRFFKVLFEALTDKWLGNPVDGARVWQALKDASPADVSALPPTLSAIVSYFTNKDLWTYEDVWKQTEKPLPYKGPPMFRGPEMAPGSELEYVPGQTPQPYVGAGQVTGLSPERMKNSVEDFITSDNFYTQLLFKGYDEFFSQLPEEQRQQALAEALTQVPGMRRFYGVTTSGAGLTTTAKGIESDRSAIRWEQDMKLDQLINGYLYNKSVKGSEVEKYIYSQKDDIDVERMEKELDFAVAIKGLPHRSWWMQLRRMDVQGRAEAFADRYMKASPAEKKQINKEYDLVIDAGGVVTDEFEARVDEVMGKKRKK